jgi:hypothetical protein
VHYDSGFLNKGDISNDLGDIEFYTPVVRVGGRLPHAWVQHNGERVSTLDLPARETLTVLAASQHKSSWRDAQTAVGRPLTVIGVTSRCAAGRCGRWRQDRRYCCARMLTSPQCLTHRAMGTPMRSVPRSID